MKTAVREDRRIEKAKGGRRDSFRGNDSTVAPKTNCGMDRGASGPSLRRGSLAPAGSACEVPRVCVSRRDAGYGAIMAATCITDMSLAPRCSGSRCVFGIPDL